MLDIVHNNLDYDEELSVARLKVSPGPGGKGLEVRPVLEQVQHFPFAQTIYNILFQGLAYAQLDNYKDFTSQGETLQIYDQVY